MLSKHKFDSLCAGDVNAFSRNSLCKLAYVFSAFKDKKSTDLSKIQRNSWFKKHIDSVDWFYKMCLS